MTLHSLRIHFSQLWFPKSYGYFQKSNSISKNKDLPCEDIPKGLQKQFWKEVPKLLFWAMGTALTFQDVYVEADNAHVGEYPAIF